MSLWVYIRQNPKEKDMRLLNKAAVAKILRVSQRTVDRLRASGELQTVKVGRGVRFIFADVALYVARHRSSEDTDNADGVDV